MTIGVPNTYDFTLPFTLDNVTSLRATFAQGDRIVLIKQFSGFDAGSRQVSTTLSEAESLQFVPGRQANIKLHATFDDGATWDSELGVVGVYGDLASGVM